MTPYDTLTRHTLKRHRQDRKAISPLRRFLKISAAAAGTGLSCIALSTLPAQQKLSVTPSTSKLFAWKSVNTQGMGYVTGIAISKFAPYDIYTRTDVGGMYRYNRTSRTWIPLLEALDHSEAPTLDIESIAADPYRQSVVYALMYRNNGTANGAYTTSGEVMMSVNRGKSWTPLGLGRHNIAIAPNGDYRMAAGERIAVSPTSQDTLFVATRRNGLWRGTRTGDAYAWTQITAGLPAPDSLFYYATFRYNNATSQWERTGDVYNDQPGFSFVVSDLPHRTLYVGVHSKGVYRSADNGATWTLLAGGPEMPLRGALASDGTLYVSGGEQGGGGRGSSGSVWRYRGNAWLSIAPSDTNSLYAGIAVHPTNPNIVVVSRDKQTWRSTNGGASWQNFPMKLRASENASAPGYYTEETAGVNGAGDAMAFDPASPNQVWGANGWGVFRTPDITAASLRWQWEMQGMEELVSMMVRVPSKSKTAGGADLVSAVGDVLGFRHESRDAVPSTKINPVGIRLPRALTSNTTDATAFNRQYGIYNGFPDWQAAGVFPNPFPHTTTLTGLDYSYNHPDHLAAVGFHNWQGAVPIHGYSQDNGRTWRAFPSVPTETFQNGSDTLTVQGAGGMIALSPAIRPGKTRPNMVWVPAAGHYGNPWWYPCGANGDPSMVPWPHYSDDGGATWRLCRLADSSQVSPFPLNLDYNNAAWNAHRDCLPKGWGNTIHPFSNAGVIVADRADPTGQIFYYYCSAGTWDGSRWGLVYYSLDGGATWYRGANGIFPGWSAFGWMVTNPLRQGEIWLCFNGSDRPAGYRLYRSLDGGRSFSVVSNVASCGAVTFGKGTGNTPFVYLFGKIGGEARNAFYKSENMGATWTRISPYGMVGVRQIEGDMRTPNLLYVTRSGRGILFGEAQASQNNATMSR